MSKKNTSAYRELWTSCEIVEPISASNVIAAPARMDFVADF